MTREEYDIAFPPSTPVSETCTFAWPGTYGHECGKPATLTAVLPSSGHMKGALYYAARCNEHAHVRSRDNTGVIRVEPRDPAHHINIWR